MRLFCAVVVICVLFILNSPLHAREKSRCIGGSCDAKIIKLVPVVEVKREYPTLAPKKPIRKAIKKIAKLPGKVVKKGVRRLLRLRVWRHKQLEKFERRSDRKHNRRRNR